MEYNQFYSCNQNLHWYKYHSRAHHPPLPSLLPLFHPLQNRAISVYNDYRLLTSSLNTARTDFLCRPNYVLGNLLPFLSHHLYHNYLHIISKFQLERIWKATVVRNLAIYGVIDHMPVFVYSHIFFFQFVFLQGALEHWCENVWLFRATDFVAEMNQLLPVPHICIRGLELFGGKNHILAIRHTLNHYCERRIWHLWKVTSRLFACALSQIRWRSLVASPSIFPPLSNLVCTSLQNPLHPLLANPFSIIEINQRQPVLECGERICDCRHPVQGSILNLFQSVQPADNGPMLLVENPRHPYFLPLVECTVVGLPHPFGKLLQGEHRLLQANWGLAFCTAKIRQIVALLSSIIFVVGHLRQWGHVCNPCIICFPRIRWRLELFGREAYGVSPRCAGRMLRWRSRAGGYWLIEWMISRRSWRHSRCTWRWRPLSWELRWGEHLRPAITTLVQVISSPR